MSLSGAQTFQYLGVYSQQYTLAHGSIAFSKPVIDSISPNVMMRSYVFVAYAR